MPHMLPRPNPRQRRSTGAGRGSFGIEGPNAETVPSAEGPAMLKLAFLFLLIGLVASLLGFTTIAGASIAVAKVLAFIFLALFAILLLAGLLLTKKVL
jgi:uncharacterized membrane protein YtjA (UPF0391 family)